VTIVYLARHGETDWNRENRWQGRIDILLNDVGRAQAAELAERVRGLGVVRVHASDLRRARETAEIVAARLAVPFLGTDERLRERGFGPFEGLTREECAARHPEEWRRYLSDHEHRPPGAETEAEVAQRMLDAVGALARQVADGPALIVTHGGPIRALVARVTGARCAPIANTALYRVVLAGEHGASRFVAAERLDSGREP
jgi:probable phosphoglycerate mutase